MRLPLILSICVFAINCSKGQDSLTFKNETTAGVFLNKTKLGGSFQHYTGLVLKDFNLETGFVVGLDNYEYFIINPIGIALKTPLFKSERLTTMFGLNAGLGLFTFHKKEKQNQYQPQVFANPNLSFRFGKSADLRVIINLGYKIQQAKITTIIPENSNVIWSNPATKTISEYKLQRVVFAVGLLF